MSGDRCGYVKKDGKPCRRRGGPCADHRWPRPTLLQLAKIPETDDAVTRFLKGMNAAVDDYLRRMGVDPKSPA